MKKFMIFLLMAFLYLGTCQARSESAHPNDASKKLLSWVTPTPSQSFLTRSNATAADFTITPNGTIYMGINSPRHELTANYPETTISEESFKWKCDGADYQSGHRTITVSDLNVGTHRIWCTVGTQTSDTVTVIVSQHDFLVNIMGPAEACENDDVTLTAQIDAPQQLTGFSYTWKVDGESPRTLAYNGQTLTFKPAVLFAGSTNNVHEFTVEISYQGCSQEISPVHIFTTIPTPSVTLYTDSVICANVIPVYTATVDGIVPEHYQWFVFPDSITAVATTTVNTYSRALDETSQEKIGVRAVYANSFCNSTFAWVNAPKYYEEVPQAENLTLSIPSHTTHKDTACAGDQVTFQVADQNTTFGQATYEWAVNGLVVEGITTNTYVATFDAVGNYEVTVNATYANYPCGPVSAKDTLTVETAPAIEVAGVNVICDGQTAALSATQGFASYAWTGPGVPANSNSYQISATQPGVYTVVGTTAAGCVSEAEDFTVYQFGGDLQAWASEYQVCPGTVVELNANLQGWNNANIHYLWSNGATGASIAATINQDTNFTVKAYVLGANDDTLCSMTQQISVTMINEALPHITVTADANACLGEQVTARITDNSTYEGLYNWYFNGVEIPGQHLDSITLTMNTVGTHLFAAKRANFQCVLDTVAASQAVTVNAIPEIVVTGNNVICQNDTAMWVATGIAGATYTWNGPSADLTTTATDSVFATTIPGVYAVSATLANCVSAPVYFTVQQLGGDLQVYASEDQVCPGTVVTLNANLQGFGNQNIQYTWTKSNDNGTIANNTGSMITDIPAPTNTERKVTYKVTAQATDVDAATTATACTIVDSVEIYVIDTARIPLNVTVATKDDICQGAQVGVKAKVASGNAVVNYYTWFMNDIEIPGQNLDSIVVNLNEPGQYNFSAKPANQNCVDQPATPANKTVTVHQVPELAIVGNNVVCNGDTAVLSAVPSNTGDLYKYSWVPSQALINYNPAEGDSTVKTLTSGIYTVTARHETSGCYATADVVVTVFGADLQVVADQTEICAGESVVLNANIDGFNNANISYTWKKYDGAVVGQGSTITVYPDLTSNKYIVVADAGIACTMTDTIEITVHARPDVATVARYDNTPYNICQGDQATFRAQPRDLAYTYVWTLNGVEIASDGRPTITLNLDEPGVYNIGAKVINQYGCASTAVSTGTLDAQVNVHAIPELTITGNSVVCNGDTATLTVNASNTGDTYTYTWTPVANILSGSNTATIKTLVAGVYNVTALNAISGCQATAQVTVSTFGGNLVVVADRTEICPEEPVVLTATLNGFNNENISYVWTKADGSNVGQGSTVTVNPDATTEYVVTANAGTSCTMNDTIEITVHERPATPTVQRYNTLYDICQGDQASFRAQPRNLSYTYVWTLNGIEIASEGRPTISLNLDEPGVYNIGAKVINEYGCVSEEVSEGTYFAQVSVHAIPELTITGNSVVCNGDTAILTVNASNTGDTYTYTWTPEANIISGSNTATIKTLTAGVYNVTAVNATSGCEATAQVTVSTFGGNLVVVADRTEICPEEPVVLTATLNGFNNENISYVWTKADGSNVGQGSTVTVNPDATTEYVVTANAGTSCTMNDTIEITVHERPATPVVARYDGTQYDICQGDQATFRAQPRDLSYTYVWTLNGVEIASEGRPTITLNLDEPGVYNVGAKVINEYGCVSEEVSQGTYFAQVSVHANPVVTLTGNHYYTTDATTATITANVLPADGEYTYAWSNGSTDDHIVVNQYGVYTVTVTNEIGCTTVSDPFTVSSVVDLQVNIEGVTTACLNDLVTLTAVVDYDLEGHTYQWYVNGSAIEGANEAHYQFVASDLYERTGLLANDFRVEINRGIENCAPVMSPVHPLLITPAPLAVVVAPEKSCKNTDVTLEAQVYEIGGDAQYQYVWYQDSEENVYDTIDYVNTIVIPAADVNHTYAVRVLFQNEACTSPISEFVPIPLYPDPETISLEVNLDEICTAGQATFTVNDNNSEEDFGAVYYDWYVNGIHAPGVHGGFFTGNFNQNGTYEVYVTATYADYPCEILYTDTIPVHVNMHPTVVITGDPIICEDHGIELFANLNDTVGSMDYTYEWRLYNYTLGNATEDINILGYHITVPAPDDLDFMDENVWSTPMLGNTNHFFASTSALNAIFGNGQFTAQDYPYIFTVVVTTPEGCRTVSEPYYVYVGEHPTVVATVDYDTVCAEGEIIARAHLGNYNMDNLTAQWQKRTQRTDANGRPITVSGQPVWTAWENIDYGTEGILHHVPGVTTQYRIVVTQTTTGCQAESEPITVTVIRPIAIDHIVAVNANPAFPTTNVCEGAQLNIQALVDSLDANGNPTGNYIVDYDHEYVWRLNGIDLNDIHGPEFSAQAGIYDSDPVDYVYSAYMVYDIPGCELVEVNSDTIHVRRNPIVTIDGNPNVCYFGPQDVNVVLTAWVDGIADPDATYTWYESGQRRDNIAGWDNNYAEKMVPTYLNPYIYTVEVTNGDGCTTISAPFEVNVYTRPYTHITGDANEICQGGEVTLRANLENYNDPMLTYQWFKNSATNQNRILGATHEIETFEPARTTDYIVMVSHLMDVNTEYCVAYDTFRVVVNDIPVVTAVNDLGGNDTICEGRTVTMVADIISGGVDGGEVYTWYRNGEVIENSNEYILVDAPVAIDNEPTSYVYAVKVQQSASGCESEVFTFDHAVVVYPNPSIALVTDPIVCVEDTNNIALYANVDPMPATAISYKWFEDNALVAQTMDSVYYFTKPYRDYPYSFAVELVNEYGCVSHADALVYVNAAPVVNIAVTDTLLCNGGEITLTAALADWNADELTYQWFDNGVAISNATTLSYTYAPAEGNHNYTFVVNQLTSGCVGTSDTLNVNVVADPVVTSISNNIPTENVVCDGYQVVLTANVTGGVNNNPVYTWYRNGAVIEGATAPTFTEVVSALNNEPTQYVYAVSVAQDEPGCESDVKVMNRFTVNPNPVVELVTDPIVCVDTINNITLVANLYPSVPTGVQYKWFENNDMFAQTTNDTISISRPYRDYPYSFSVSIENEYGCSATSEALVYVNANPVVTINVTENNICEGGEITLTAALADWNEDMLTFQWYDNNVAIPGATRMSYTYVPQGVRTHNYTLVVEQLTSGCIATSNELPVVVNAIPVITSVTTSAQNICYGSQITVTATVNSDRTDGIFTWFRNGHVLEGAVAGTIFDTPAIIDNNVQQYNYTAMVTFPEAGCTSLPVSTTTPVIVYPNPRPQITGDQFVCETDSVFLIANVDTVGYNVGHLHYTWYESGQIRDNMGYNLGDNNFFAEYLYPRDEPYRFTVDVWRDDIADGCQAHSEEYLVYVFTQPVVNITATETNICTNGEVTLTANLDDYNAENLTYHWYEIREQQVISAYDYDPAYNDYEHFLYDTSVVQYRYYIPGATSPTYTTTLTDTTIIGVDVFQTHSTCSANDEIIINVAPIPVITEVIAVDEVVCNGAQIIVAASTDQDNDEAGVYTWYRNGFEIEGAHLPIFTENVFTTDNHVTTNYYSAIVTFPGSGCVSAMSPEAMVTINPAPTSVTITGNNVICEGDSTVLTVSSDVEGIITWSNGSHESSIKVPAGVYTVTVSTTEEEACEMTSEPFTVESFGTDILVSASATAICQGEHTTLFVDQEGWQGNVTYQWDAQAGNSTASTVDVTPAATTTYHVTATVTNNNGSCTAEGQVTIVVNPLPVITAVTVSDTVICQGQQVTFTATADSTATAYIWYNNGHVIAGENQAVLTVNFNEAGVYNYSVKAISNEQCVSADAVAAPAVVVTPAPTTVTITGNNVICQNDSTVLTAHSDVEGTFTWNDGTVGATHVVEAGVYNVTLETAEGCSMTSDNFTVEAFGTQVLVSATATNICEGEHTTLSVEQNGWVGNVAFEWSTGSNATTIDVQPDTTTTYTVTATVTNAAGTCQAVGEITINVNPRPETPIIFVSADSICTGSQVVALIVGGHDNMQVTWYMDGYELPGMNVPQILFDAEEGVHYVTATVTSEEGCVSDRGYAPGLVPMPAHYFGVAAPESVVITGIDNFCDGGNTTLYANVTATAPASAITYAWYKDGVAMNNVPTADHITVTAAGSYKVVATVSGICSTESMSYDVTVAEAPQMQLTATETEICVGGTTVITAEVTGWNNSDVNYNWNNGFQGSAYTFNATTAGVETFIVTASQSTSGCVATDTINITVNAVPATPVVTVDNATICDGGQVTLAVSNAVAGASYEWTRNGVVISDAHQATLTESPVTVDGDATIYVYTATAIVPMSGCTSAASADAIVTVVPTPVVAVTVEGNTTICDGGSTTLHANVTPLAAYSYQWYKDNAVILGANSADYTVAEVARETAYNFTVVVTANPGCNVTAAAPAITVVADPVVTATISNDITCVGGTATLTAVVDGGVAGVNGLNGYTYEWYRNTNTTTEFVANTPSFTTSSEDAAGNYSYWVTVTSNYGCQSTSDPVNYSIVADPVVTISVVNGYATTVCNGGSTAIKANVTGGYGDITYQWYKNGTIMNGETNQTLNIPVLNYGDNDVYTVEIAQTGIGCANNASANINTLVSINPSYTVDIAGFGNVCEGGNLTLTATVNNVITGDVLSYQWYRIVNGENAVAIQGANAAQYSTSDLLLGDSYDYYVVVTSAINGCSTVSNTVPANVVARPSVTINGANTVCEGGDLTLNAFVTGGVEGAAYTYVWNWTGAAQGTETTAVPTFVPSVAANDAATPYYFTVTISRADNTGCTATSEAHEVNVLAAPSVTITADNNYVCANGQVTFTAHVAPVGSYNYVWTVNGTQQAVNANTVTASIANVGTISASVIVSAANASASCSATATIAAPVQVVAAPTVTIAADHTEMCVGGTTTLTANVTANSNIPGDITYQWAINGIEVEGAVANTFVQPLNAAGSYTYTLRVAQNNNLGCASTWSAPVTVQVAEQPVVALNSADGLAICEGGSVTLTGVVTNYNNTVNGVTNSNIYGNMTFNWLSNGVIAHSNTPVTTAMNQITETLNTVGNYSYQVVVSTSGYNCQPQSSNVEVVNVVGNPSWTEVHVYSSHLLDGCIGDLVTLQAAIQGGAFDYAYYTGGHIQWTVTDQNGNTTDVSGGLGGNSYDLPTQAGTYTYTPTFVGNIGSGCQLTNTGAVAAAITIHELPTATFTSGDGASICSNDPSASVELVIAFTGVAPFQYEVVDGNGNVVAAATTMANTASIFVAPSEQTTYRINLVADAYCENTSFTSDAIATVFVNEIEFSENFFESGCNDNGQVTIHFNMISGNPQAAFTVVYNNGLQDAGTISNNSATFAAPSAPGDYTAVFTVDGCSYDIVVRVLAGDYAFGGSLPIMDQRWNDVVVVNNNPATNGGHTFVGFQWYRNGVAIPGAIYSNYQEIGGLNGFYSVELIEQDANGNMITYKTCEMYFNAVSTVKVYPVPANVRQEITIELDLTAEELEGAVLDIYSVTGALINHVTDLTPITKIEGFKAQGTYFGRILTGTNEIKTVKFVIVK